MLSGNGLLPLQYWLQKMQNKQKVKEEHTPTENEQTIPSSLSTVRIPLIPGERITHNPLPFLPCCFLPWGTTLWWHKSSYFSQQKSPSLALSTRNHLQTRRQPNHFSLSPFPSAIFSFACLNMSRESEGLGVIKGDIPLFKKTPVLSTQDVRGTTRKNKK